MSLWSQVQDFSKAAFHTNTSWIKTNSIEEMKSDVEEFKTAFKETTSTAHDHLNKMKKSLNRDAIIGWFEGESQSLDTADSSEYDAGMEPSIKDDADGENGTAVDTDKIEESSRSQRKTMVDIGRQQAEMSMANTAQISGDISNAVATIGGTLTTINKNVESISKKLDNLIFVTEDAAKKAQDAAKGGLYNSDGTINSGALLRASNEKIQNNMILSNIKSFFEMDGGSLGTRLGSMMNLKNAGEWAETINDAVNYFGGDKNKDKFKGTGLFKGLDAIGGLMNSISKSWEKTTNDIKDMYDSLKFNIASKAGEINVSNGKVNIGEIDKDRYSNKAAMFDRKTQTTIVDIIPNYLSHIRMELEKFNSKTSDQIKQYVVNEDGFIEEIPDKKAIIKRTQDKVKKELTYMSEEDRGAIKTRFKKQRSGLEKLTDDQLGALAMEVIPAIARKVSNLDRDKIREHKSEIVDDLVTNSELFNDRDQTNLIIGAITDDAIILSKLHSIYINNLNKAEEKFKEIANKYANDNEVNDLFRKTSREESNAGSVSVINLARGNVEGNGNVPSAMLNISGHGDEDNTKVSTNLISKNDVKEIKDNVSKTFSDLGENIKKSFEGFIDVMPGIIKDTFKSVTKTISSFVTEKTTSAYKSVMTKNVQNKIKNARRDIKHVKREGITDNDKTHADTALKILQAAISNSDGTVDQGEKESALKEAEKITDQDFKDSVKTSIEQLSTKAVNIKEDASKKGIFSKVLSVAGGFISNKLHSVVSVVRSGFGLIFKPIKMLGSTVGKILKTVIKMAVKVGVAGVKHTARGAVGIAKYGTGIVKDGTSLINQLLVGAPLKLFGAGIKDLIGGTDSKISKGVRGTTNVVKGVGKGIGATGKLLGDTIGQAGKDIVNIGKNATNLGYNLNSKLGKFGEGLNKGLGLKSSEEKQKAKEEAEKKAKEKTYEQAKLEHPIEGSIADNLDPEKKKDGPMATIIKYLKGIFENTDTNEEAKANREKEAADAKEKADADAKKEKESERKGIFSKAGRTAWLDAMKNLLPKKVEDAIENMSKNSNKQTEIAEEQLEETKESNDDAKKDDKPTMPEVDDGTPAIRNNNSSDSASEGSSGGKKKSKLAETASAIGGGLKDTASSLLGNIGGMLGSIMSSVGGIVEIVMSIASVIGIVDGIKEAFKEAYEKGLKPLKGITEKLTDFLQPVLEMVTGVLTTLSDAIADIVDSLIDVLQPIMETLMPIISELVSDILTPILNLIKPLMSMIMVPLMSIMENIVVPNIKIIAGLLQVVAGGVIATVGALEWLAGAILGAIGSVLNIIGKGDSLVSAGDDLKSTGMESMNSGSGMVTKGLKSVAEGAVDLMKGIVNVVIDSGKQAVEEVDDGVVQPVKSVINRNNDSDLTGNGDVDIYGNGNFKSQKDYGSSLMKDHGCGPVALADAVNRRTGASIDAGDLASSMSKNGSFGTKGTSVGNMISTSKALGSNVKAGGVTSDSLKSASPNNPITVAGSGSSFGTKPGNIHYMNVIGSDNKGNALVNNPLTGKTSATNRAALAGSSLLGLYGSGDSDDEDSTFTFSDTIKSAFKTLKNLFSSFLGMFSLSDDEDSVDEMMELEKFDAQWDQLQSALRGSTTEDGTSLFEYYADKAWEKWKATKNDSSLDNTTWLLMANTDSNLGKDWRRQRVGIIASLMNEDGIDLAAEYGLSSDVLAQMSSSYASFEEANQKAQDIMDAANASVGASESSGTGGAADLLKAAAETVVAADNAGLKTYSHGTTTIEYDDGTKAEFRPDCSGFTSGALRRLFGKTKQNEFNRQASGFVVDSYGNRITKASQISTLFDDSKWQILYGPGSTSMPQTWSDENMKAGDIVAYKYGYEGGPAPDGENTGHVAMAIANGNNFISGWSSNLFANTAAANSAVEQAKAYLAGEELSTVANDYPFEMDKEYITNVLRYVGSKSAYSGDGWIGTSDNPRDQEWNYLITAGFAPEQAAGIMGCHKCESSDRFVPVLGGTIMIDSSYASKLSGDKLSKYNDIVSQYNASKSKSTWDASEMDKRTALLYKLIDEGIMTKDAFTNPSQPILYERSYNNDTGEYYDYRNQTGFGYGLMQFTAESLKKDLWNNTIGSGYELKDMGAQVQTSIDALKKYNPGVFDQFEDATTPEGAACYYFYAAEAGSPETVSGKSEEAVKEIEANDTKTNHQGRAVAAREIYDLYKDYAVEYPTSATNLTTGRDLLDYANNGGIVYVTGESTAKQIEHQRQYEDLFNEYVASDAYSKLSAQEKQRLMNAYEHNTVTFTKNGNGVITVSYTGGNASTGTGTGTGNGTGTGKVTTKSKSTLLYYPHRFTETQQYKWNAIGAETDENDSYNTQVNTRYGTELWLDGKYIPDYVQTFINNGTDDDYFMSSAELGDHITDKASSMKKLIAQKEDDYLYQATPYKFNGEDMWTWQKYDSRINKDTTYNTKIETAKGIYDDLYVTKTDHALIKSNPYMTISGDSINGHENDKAGSYDKLAALYGSGDTPGGISIPDFYGNGDTSSSGSLFDLINQTANTTANSIDLGSQISNGITSDDINKLMNHTFDVKSESIESLLTEIRDELQGKHSVKPTSSSKTNRPYQFNNEIPSAVQRMARG